MKQKNLVIFAHGAMRLNDAKYVDEFTNKINATIKETFKKNADIVDVSEEIINGLSEEIVIWLSEQIVNGLSEKIVSK